MIEESEDEEDEHDEDVPELQQSTNDDIDAYRQQLQNEINFSESKMSKAGDDSIRRYIESCTQYLGNIKLGPEVEIPESTPKPGALQPQTLTEEANSKTPETKVAFEIPSDVTKTNLESQAEKEETSSNQPNQDDSDALSLSSNDLETDNVPELVNVDPNSRMYRLKMVEKILEEARSHRSYSTSASTIAPSVVTDRIRRNMDKKEKIDMRKRCVAKGEASAVHRHRKENKDVVKEYAGWDF